MAKFNITVELDWINEEGGIDNIVKEEIIHNIASRFSNKLNEDILETAQKKVSKQINSCIDIKVNEIIETMLNKEFPLIDSYGDVLKEKVTVIGLIKERLDNFLEEKVNKIRANILKRQNNQKEYDGKLKTIDLEKTQWLEQKK